MRLQLKPMLVVLQASLMIEPHALALLRIGHPNDDAQMSLPCPSRVMGDVAGLFPVRSAPLTAVCRLEEMSQPGIEPAV
ncbi:hypothetical protein [Synechococcus sp. MIT S9503]|uniref:hypothetical protein n=1 Tax=Synechococcus sp. MIT S9503 TaxID=3082547 RepID=UPI0039A740CB